MTARPTIDVVSLARCRRRIGSSDSKRGREEAGVTAEARPVAEAVGGAGSARQRQGCRVSGLVSAAPRGQV
jgi:hypothetical protein